MKFILCYVNGKKGCFSSLNSKCRKIEIYQPANMWNGRHKTRIGAEHKMNWYWWVCGVATVMLLWVQEKELEKGWMAFRQETWTENVTCKIAFIIGSNYNRGWWEREKKRRAYIYPLYKIKNRFYIHFPHFSLNFLISVVVVFVFQMKFSGCINICFSRQQCITHLFTAIILKFFLETTLLLFIKFSQPNRTANHISYDLMNLLFLLLGENPLSPS